MTISEAKTIVKAFEQNSIPSQEDDESFISALEFLISEQNDKEAMTQLAGFYYGQKQFDKALEYYDKAADDENIQAHIGLGYIWYYGRTGKTDYEKAYEHFRFAADKGDINAIYKVADMYRNGFHVEKDYDKYKELMEALYKRVNTNELEWYHLPEVCARLSRIRKQENKLVEAVDLLMKARNILEYRLQNNPFFGDLTTMKFLVKDLYSIIMIDETYFGLYDLFYVLETPKTVSFKYNRRPFTVRAMKSNNGLAIRFDEEWFRDIDDFFARACINGKRITSLNNSLYDFAIEP